MTAKIASLQVMGPDDSYLIQYSDDTKAFWADSGSLALGACFKRAGQAAPPRVAVTEVHAITFWLHRDVYKETSSAYIQYLLKGHQQGLMARCLLMLQKQFSGAVAEGFQASLTSHQGQSYDIPARSLRNVLHDSCAYTAKTARTAQSSSA